MVNCGYSKVKLYEGGQLELQVAGPGGKSAVILDKDGNMFLCCDGTLQIQAANVKVMSKGMVETDAKTVVSQSTGQTVVQGSQVTVSSMAGRTLIKSPVNQAGKMI